MLLAFSTFDALFCRRAVLSEGDSLEILLAAGALVFRVHVVVAGEYARYVDPLRARHAVAAAGAADFRVLVDDAFDLLDHGELVLAERACLH